MERDREEVERQDVVRELEERSTEERRQRSGSTPPERLMERALEIEPGAEQHVGEDSGALAERSDPE